jgi:hypothetical protein
MAMLFGNDMSPKEFWQRIILPAFWQRVYGD